MLRLRPMPISADTAVKLAAFMKVPIEHLMHMPQHVMLQKLAEMAMAEGAAANNGGSDAKGTEESPHGAGDPSGESGKSEENH